MKKIVSALIILAFLITLTACASDKPQEVPEPAGQITPEPAPPALTDAPAVQQPPPEPWQFYEDDEQLEFMYPYVIDQYLHGRSSASKQPYVWDTPEALPGSMQPNLFIKHANVFVVEYEGDVSKGFIFSAQRGASTFLFSSADESHGRIVESDGKLIFDISGLSADGCRFILSDTSAAKVASAYYDRYPHDEINPSPKTIYVDAGNNDAGDGTESNPYRDLSDALYAADTSDTIIVADGVYYGSFSLPSGTRGRPATLKAADGAKPVLTTAIPIEANWSAYDGDIYVADVPDDIIGLMETQFPQLFVDSTAMVEARYPNIGQDMTTIMDQKRAVAAKGTYAEVIVAPDDIPSDIVGATAVFWAGDQGMTGQSSDTGKIASVNGRTITLTKTFKNEADLVTDTLMVNRVRPVPGNPFFITGALALLDAPGEYYFDIATGKLYFYAPDGKNPNDLNLSLKSSQRFAVDMEGVDYVIVDGFDIYGSGISIAGTYNTVKNCRVLFADHFYRPGSDDLMLAWLGQQPATINTHGGIMVYGTKNTVTRCEVGYTANIGINTWGYYNKITDNIIHDCNYSGTTYGAINIDQSKYLEVSRNTISFSGRDHIYMIGYGYRSYPNIDPDDPLNWAYAGCIIRNNHLINHAVLNSDSGAFYTGGINGGGTELFENLVEFGTKGDLGAMKKLLAGLYFDEAAFDFVIRNNIIDGRGLDMDAVDSFCAGIPLEKLKFSVLNNTIVAMPVGLNIGASFTSHIDMVIKDNLFADMRGAYDFQGETVINGQWSFGRFKANETGGTVPITYGSEWGEIVSSGNVRGTIDENYRPAGDTPKNAGAIPEGGEMFDYGATWSINR